MIVILIVAAVLLIIRAYIVTNVDIRDTETRIFAARIHYAPTSIILFDNDLNRAFPGIIDLEKFNDFTLMNSIVINDNSFIAAKLSLYNLDGKPIKSAYFDQVWYERWEPLAESRIGGPGGADKFTFTRNVLFKGEDPNKPYIYMKQPTKIPDGFVEMANDKRIYYNKKTNEILISFEVYDKEDKINSFNIGMVYEEKKNEFSKYPKNVELLKKYIKEKKTPDIEKIDIKDKKMDYIFKPKGKIGKGAGVMVIVNPEGSTDYNGDCIIKVDYKPAIYLYPEKKTDIHVRIKPNGRLILTIPYYDETKGWDVEVDPSGRIDGKYDYLFYEAEINDINLPTQSYVVSYEDLDTFLTDLLPKLGLNENEAKQFKEYWINKLPYESYYQIFLLDRKEIERIEPLVYVNPTPDMSIRVRLYFKPLTEKDTTEEPTLPAVPERKGFSLVEWGGFLEAPMKSVVCYEPSYSPGILKIEVITPNS